MTYNTPSSVWTPDLVEQLKTLWAADELSCSGIAAELGHGISRNAVIGKAQRMGLPKKGQGRTKPQHIPKQRKAPVERASIRKVGQATFIPIDDDEPDTDPKSVAELEAQTPPATFRGITFIDLEPQHCRYPRTVDGSTLYCGQVKIEDSVYCRGCHRRCHSRANYALNTVRRAA